LKSFSVDEFSAAGCPLYRDLVRIIFAPLWVKTGGKPCLGCAHDSYGGKCESRKKLEAADMQNSREDAVPGETVKQEAARLGVSIGEVRRRRQSA